MQLWLLYFILFSKFIRCLAANNQAFRYVTIIEIDSGGLEYGEKIHYSHVIVMILS